MSSKRLARRKGVISSGAAQSNSLDWDSPSTKTGTVKRRPLSSDSESSVQLQQGNSKNNNSPERYDSRAPESNQSVFSLRRHKFDGSCIPAYSGVKTSKQNNIQTTAKTKRNNTATVIGWKQTIKQNSNASVREAPSCFYRNNERSFASFRQPEGETKSILEQNKGLVSGVHEPKKNSNVASVVQTNKPEDGLFAGGLQNGGGLSKPCGFGFDKANWIALSEANAYLIERKSCGYSSTSKTGKVSDSDSGIASPLSPSSLYGFLGSADKEDRYGRNAHVRKEIEILQNCSCIKQHVQVGKIRGSVIYLYVKI